MGKAFLLVVGHNSAGKSTVAKVLADKLSLTIIEFGTEVRRFITEDSSLPRDPSLAFVILKRRHGPNLLSLWAAKRSFPHGLIMVGVRDEESYEALGYTYPDLITVAVVAKSAVRYYRDYAKQTDGSPNQLSMKEFNERDRLHTSWGLSKIIETADFTIENSSNLQALEQQVNSMVRFLSLRS